MTRPNETLEERMETIEKQIEILGPEIAELLRDTRAKKVRIEEIENLAADIDDRLLTMADDLEYLKDVFENMDNKLDILATLLMPEE